MVGVLFTIRVTSCNTWNGSHSYTEKYNAYKKLKNDELKKKYPLLKEGNYPYMWEDGWSINVNVKFMKPSEARKAHEDSKGFMGYDHFINEIMEYGEIKNEIIC